MTELPLIVYLSFIAWTVGMAAYPLLNDFENEPSEYIWWPLLLIKTALKGLWSVLFTGWRV